MRTPRPVAARFGRGACQDPLGCTATLRDPLYSKECADAWKWVLLGSVNLGAVFADLAPSAVEVEHNREDVTCRFSVNWLDSSKLTALRWMRGDLARWPFCCCCLASSWGFYLPSRLPGGSPSPFCLLSPSLAHHSHLLFQRLCSFGLGSLPQPPLSSSALASLAGFLLKRRCLQTFACLINSPPVVCHVTSPSFSSKITKSAGSTVSYRIRARPAHVCACPLATWG